ncbi:MAG: hypothetical protein KBD78_13655 [Oligoflexales bacterium]|nr:hypothetical protein [Oligoflexales bacterium]
MSFDLPSKFKKQQLADYSENLSRLDTGTAGYTAYVDENPNTPSNKIPINILQTAFKSVKNQISGCPTR